MRFREDLSAAQNLDACARLGRDGAGAIHVASREILGRVAKRLPQLVQDRRMVTKITVPFYVDLLGLYGDGPQKLLKSECGGNEDRLAVVILSARHGTTAHEIMMAMHKNRPQPLNMARILNSMQQFIRPKVMNNLEGIADPNLPKSIKTAQFSGANHN